MYMLVCREVCVSVVLQKVGMKCILWVIMYSYMNKNVHVFMEWMCNTCLGWVMISLLLQSLSQGTTVVENLLDSEDVRYMVGALRSLGLDVQEDRAANKAIVVGCSGRFPVGSKAQPVELFLGNAGTAMRPLTAVVAAAGGLARSSSFSCSLFFV